MHLKNLANKEKLAHSTYLKLWENYSLNPFHHLPKTSMNIYYSWDVFKQTQLVIDSIPYMISIGKLTDSDIDYSPYPFLNAIKKMNLTDKVQDNIFVFAHRCTENVKQHAHSYGFFAWEVRGEYIYFVTADKGQGFLDLDKDGIPDILQAKKYGVSLDKVNGRYGTGFSTAIDSVEFLELHTNGYLWHKDFPNKVLKSSSQLTGSLIIAKTKVVTK